MTCTAEETRVFAIESRWTHTRELWVHGPAARADVAWLVSELKRLREGTAEQLAAIRECLTYTPCHCYPGDPCPSCVAMEALRGLEGKFGVGPHTDQEETAGDEVSQP